MKRSDSGFEFARVLSCAEQHSVRELFVNCSSQCVWPEHRGELRQHRAKHRKYLRQHRAQHRAQHKKKLRRLRRQHRKNPRAQSAASAGGNCYLGIHTGHLGCCLPLPDCSIAGRACHTRRRHANRSWYTIKQTTSNFRREKA